MLLRKYILLLIFSVFRLTHSAQDCKLDLHGQIRDADNGEGLGFSVVSILNNSQVMQTDEQGDFFAKGLCAGQFSVLVQHAGCRDTVFVITLKRSSRVVFKLPHQLNTLNDVEVIAKHEDPKPTQSSTTLDLKDLDKLRGQNLGDQLKQVNGITTFNTGPTISKPMINGMQGYRILILNNGVRQEGQQWGSEHAPEIDPFIANKLTVLRGASAVRYGSDAIGGVILVEPDDMPDSASVTGDLNLVGISNSRGGAAALRLQGYFDKLKYFSWRVQGSLKRAGDLKTPDYFLKNTGVGEKNFSYALSYHRKKFGVSVYYSQFNNRLGIFSGAHTGNLSDLLAAFNRRKPADSLAEFSYSIDHPYQNTEHELVKVSSDVHTGKRSRININYAYQFNLRQEFDEHGSPPAPSTSSGATGGTEDIPASEYRLGTHTAETFWEHDYIRSLRGQYGVQAMYQENRYAYKFFIPNYINRTVGVFATERFVRSRYELEAGVRYDIKKLQSFYYEDKDLVSPERTFDNTSLNLGYIYKPNSVLKFNLHTGSGWRAPSPNELYSNGLHHGVGAIEHGNKNLQTERCISFTGSGLWQTKKWRAELTAYTYQFTDYIYYLPSDLPQLTIRGAFPVFNYTQNDASISGADVAVKYSPAKFLDIKTRAMLVRGRNKESGEHMFNMPADRAELSFQIKIKDTKYLRDLYFEPVVQYVAKQWRVQPGIDFVPPPSAYFLAGVTAGAELVFGKQPLFVSFSATNITNTMYRDYLDRFRYYADSPGQNFTLRLRIPFTLYDKK